MYYRQLQKSENWRRPGQYTWWHHLIAAHLLERRVILLFQYYCVTHACTRDAQMYDRSVYDP